MVQVSDREAVILQVFVWVVDRVVRELGDRVRRVDLVIDEALVQLVLHRSAHIQRASTSLVRGDTGIY